MVIIIKGWIEGKYKRQCPSLIYIEDIKEDSRCTTHEEVRKLGYGDRATNQSKDGWVEREFIPSIIITIKNHWYHSASLNTDIRNESSVKCDNIVEILKFNKGTCG